MRAVWTMWIALWRRRPVSIASPLSVEAAAAVLAADVSSPWKPRAVGGYGRWRALGVVRDGDVSVRAQRGETRNSWTSRLEARFVPTEEGSVLVGSLGTNPVVSVFTALWLGLVGLGWLGTLIVGVTNLFAERWSAERGAWAVFGALSVFVAFGVGVTVVGGWMARSSEEFLRSWLAHRLSGATPARQRT